MYSKADDKQEEWPTLQAWKCSTSACLKLYLTAQVLLFSTCSGCAEIFRKHQDVSHDRVTSFQPPSRFWLSDLTSLSFFFFLWNLSPNWSWVAPCSTEEIEQTKWDTGRAERAERHAGLKVRQERQTEGENEDRPRRRVSSGIFHTIFHSYHQILGLRFSPGLTDWQSIFHQLCLRELLTKWQP